MGARVNGAKCANVLNQTCKILWTSLSHLEICSPTHFTEHSSLFCSSFFIHFHRVSRYFIRFFTYEVFSIVVLLLIVFYFYFFAWFPTLLRSPCFYLPITSLLLSSLIHRYTLSYLLQFEIWLILFVLMVSTVFFASEFVERKLPCDSVSRSPLGVFSYTLAQLHNNPYRIAEYIFKLFQFHAMHKTHTHLHNKARICIGWRITLFVETTSARRCRLL